MKVGETLEGRYELRESLGSGGLGEVFRAWDTKLRREVTVKALDPSRCQPGALRRLADSLAAVGRVKHPGVVPAHMPAGSIPLIVSETPRGEDLNALRARLAPVPWGRAVELVQACAEALAAVAATTRAAHRALKPGNVWIVGDGSIRILDFGIAELGVPPARPRADGVYVDYRAPEQIEGGPGDATSDVFSLAVMLFELLTGVHPFAGATAFQVSRKIVMQPAPRTAELAPGVSVPAQIEALLARAFARSPAERFKDAAEMASHLSIVRRSPGAMPRASAAPAPAKPPVEETQSIPAAAPPEEDGTTAVSLPSLRGLLAKANPATPTPLAPAPAAPPPAKPEPAPAPPPLVRPAPAPAASPSAVLPPLEDRTLELGQLRPIAPGDTLALPSPAPRAAAPEDDGPTTVLPRLAPKAPPLVDATEVLSVGPRARRDPQSESTLALPDTPPPAQETPPVSRPPAREPATQLPGLPPPTSGSTRPWIIINVALGGIIVLLLVAVLLRG